MTRASAGIDAGGEASVLLGPNGRRIHPSARCDPSIGSGLRVKEAVNRGAIRTTERRGLGYGVVERRQSMTAPAVRLTRESTRTEARRLRTRRVTLNRRYVIG